MNLRHYISLAFTMCLAGVAVTGLSPVVRAETGGSGSVADDIITAEVRFDAVSQDSPCVWEPVSHVPPVTVTKDGVQYTETLVYKACDNRIMSYHWIRNDAPRKIVDSAESKVSRAIKMLFVRTAPSTRDVVVKSDMWFWVPKSVWKPVRVTAWVATPTGPISVTVTAQPYVLSLSPGDGQPEVRCLGPGTPWNSRIGLQRDSDCTYQYVRPSHSRHGSHYAARAAITWKVSWTSNLGIGGPLPSVRTSLSLPIRVNELQVLLR